MKIILEDIGKRFNREWVFKNINLEFENSDGIVILGGNGSGKSTFLKVLAGNCLPSEGSIKYFDEQAKTIAAESIFKSLSFSSPYLELFDEFSLKETLNFHSKFKPLLLGNEEIIELAYLDKAAEKPIKHFSSGMKQRVRLALAILSKCPILFLDEPTSNLDLKGISWYKEIIEKYAKNKLVFVGSNNQENEYFFCNKTINIESYKA